MCFVYFVVPTALSRMKYHPSLLPGTMIALALATLEAFAQSTYEPYTFTTLAGVGPGNADGTGSAARFNYPTGVAVDGAGNVYVGDTWNNSSPLPLVPPVRDDFSLSVTTVASAKPARQTCSQTCLPKACRPSSCHASAEPATLARFRRPHPIHNHSLERGAGGRR